MQTCCLCLVGTTTLVQGIFWFAVICGRTAQLQDLYLLGGNDGHQWLDLVDIVSPDVRRWRSGPKLPSARGYGAAAAIGQHLFMVGGGNGTAWLNTTIMLDPTHGWQQVRQS